MAKPYYGKMKIAKILRRDHGIVVSASWVGTVIKAHKLQYLWRTADSACRFKKTVKRRKARKRPPALSVPEKSGTWIQIDTVVLYWKGKRVYVLCAVDLTSRFGIAFAYNTPSSRNAKDFLQKVRLFFAGTIALKMVQTDNGGEFLKYFDAECTAQGIEHTFSRPKSPKMNAFVERFNETIQIECLKKTDAMMPMYLLNEKIRLWLEEYNAYRPHASLDYRTPLDEYVAQLHPTNREVHTMYVTRTRNIFLLPILRIVIYSACRNDASQHHDNADYDDLPSEERLRTELNFLPSHPHSLPTRGWSYCMELSASSSATYKALLCASAVACATVANQPTFDCGGFPIVIRKSLCGNLQPWEVFYDQVTIVGIKVALGQTTSLSLSVNSTEPDAPSLPATVHNNSAGRSVLEALRVMEDRDIDWRWQLHIIVRKGISLKGTGLGSSGASAAAALKAFEGFLEQLPEKINFSEKEKIQILTVADAGVPDNSIPAYSGGWIILDNRNPDRWEHMEINPTFGRWIIACPRGFGIKTALARTVLPSIIPDQRLDIDALKDAVTSGDSEAYGRMMEEAHAWFTQPRSRLYPDKGNVYDCVYQAAKNAGALGVTISGAGPSILALVKNDEDAYTIGSAMHAAFQSCGFDSVALLADISSTGAIAVPPFSYDVP